MKPGSSPMLRPALRDASPALFQVTLDADQRPCVRVAEPSTSSVQPATPEKKPRALITRGSVTVKIYGRKNGPFTIAWRTSADGPRERAMRSDWKRATTLAEKKATELANGEAWKSQIGQTQFAFLSSCQKQAAEIGRSPEEIFQKGLEAIRAENSVARIVDKSCPQLVAELLAKPRQRKRGSKWQRVLAGMLNEFAKYWTGPIHLLKPSDVNRWLDTLTGGLDNRFHHRAAMLQLARYAVAHNHATHEWLKELIKFVECQGRAEVTIKIWSPDQLTMMFAGLSRHIAVKARAIMQRRQRGGKTERLTKERETLENLIVFVAIQSFAGIRHEELSPEEFDVANKVPLDWSDFDWEQKHVEVREETGKTGARIVPLSDNLIEWLKPYAKEGGPVCTVANMGDAMGEAKRRAGLPAGRNQSRNIFRKSFGSYRLAVVKHIGQVAEEMGNSPAKIKTNYRKPKPEREGKRWFAICPTAAEILQLKLVGV